MEDKSFSFLSTSSIETEMISVAHCATEVAFLRKLAEELGFIQVSPTIIYEDNNGCIALGNSGHFKDHSRHIDLCYMFLSDYIARGLVKFERVDSKNQIADIGTAPRPWPVLKKKSKQPVTKFSPVPVYYCVLIEIEFNFNFNSDMS